MLDHRRLSVRSRILKHSTEWDDRATTATAAQLLTTAAAAAAANPISGAPAARARARARAPRARAPQRHWLDLVHRRDRGMHVACMKRMVVALVARELGDRRARRPGLVGSTLRGGVAAWWGVENLTTCNSA